MKLEKITLEQLSDNEKLIVGFIEEHFGALGECKTERLSDTLMPYLFITEYAEGKMRRMISISNENLVTFLFPTEDNSAVLTATKWLGGGFAVYPQSVSAETGGKVVCEWTELTDKPELLEQVFGTGRFTEITAALSKGKAAEMFAEMESRYKELGVEPGEHRMKSVRLRDLLDRVQSCETDPSGGN